MDRRAFVRAAAGVGTGAIAGAAVWGGLVEPGLLSVTRHTVPPRQDADPLDATLVQISDLHFGGLADVHEELVDAVAGSRPDLIVLTGDSAEEPEGLPALDEMLATLPSGVPVLAVMGNWEYQGGVSAADLARVLRGRGGRLLVNETVDVELPGGTLRVTGVDDLVQGRPDLGTAAAGRPPVAHHVLLAHCPGYRDRLPPPPGGAHTSSSFDLMLSGHTHGGQIDLFGLRWTPRGSGRYVEGWYREEGAPAMYVSRGVGTSLVPLRIGARPEVAIFEV